MVFENRYFIMYAISALCVMSVLNVPFLTLPVMMSSYGYSPNEQAMIITTTGIASKFQHDMNCR